MFYLFRLSTGETIIIVLALGLVILLPFIIIGIVLFVLRRNKKNRENWNLIARKLNLTMPNPQKLEMSGFYNNRQIKLSVGARRANDSTEFFTYCVTEFPHSLRFLLNINSPKGLFSKVFDSNSMKLGQAVFDEKFNVSCYDENVLRRLLISDFPSNKTQNLMGDLMLAKQSFGVINITDHKVYLETGGQISDENLIGLMLDLTANLANRFQKAREQFPLTDWEKRLFANWQKFADDNRLSFDSKNIVIQGNYKNFSIRISLETDNGKFQTKIHLQFGKSLMMGLKLMPENSIHKAMTWLGVQDIETGIKEFDEAFIVKAENSQQAKHALNPTLCHQLVGLAKQSSSFEINDNEIVMCFGQILGDEMKLRSNLEAIILTAKMFHNRN